MTKRRSAAQMVDDGKSLAEMWAGFAAMTMPTVPKKSLQYEDMHKAFYAGALCLFNFLMSQLDPGEDITADDFARMEAIDAELRAFADSVRSGRTVQ